MTKIKVARVITGIAICLFSSVSYGAACIDQAAVDSLKGSITARKHGELTDGLVEKIDKKILTDYGDIRVRENVSERIADILKGVPVETNIEGDKLKEVSKKILDSIVASCEQLVNSSISARKLAGGNSEYYFIIGTAQTLQPAGGFDADTEVTFRSSTLYDASTIPALSKRMRGTVELTYRDLDGSDDSEMETASTLANAADIFSAEKGSLRFDATLDPWHYDEDSNEGFGMRSGIGFSTIPDGSSSDTRARGRYYLGTVFRANYGKSSSGKTGTGEFFLGYAIDESWRFTRTIETTDDNGDTTSSSQRLKEQGRIVLDGRLNVPGFFAAKEVRLHTRFFADLPASGRGPSDIRLSLLLSVDIGKIFSFGN